MSYIRLAALCVVNLAQELGILWSTIGTKRDDYIAHFAQNHNNGEEDVKAM